MTKRMIYSTLFLTDGAQGGQTLFTIPLGQPMAGLIGSDYRCDKCGSFSTPTQTREHTNITMAGEFGSAIGDVRLVSMQALTSDGSRLMASYNVRVAGQPILGGALYEIDKEPRKLPDIIVKRTDTFEVLISLDHRLKRTKEQGPMFLKIEFWGEPVGDPA